MKKIIDKWVHIPGIHCGSVTLRDVMTYWGYPWSEAMCFGIGGGLGFYYTVRDDISPTRMIFVRGPGMEPAFFSLAVEPVSWKHADENALSIIKSSVDKDVPVIIQTDIYYLDYYNSSTHFPGHIVSVWGYDDDSETMYVADTHFEGLMSVPYGKFLDGMGSKSPPNPLDYNYMDIIPDRRVRPLTDIIPEAIRLNAVKMLEGRTGSRGESGVGMIKEWSKDLPSWKDAPDWKWCARFGYQVIEKRGVGGGGFRWIYRDFLKEAEGIMPELRALNLSIRMNHIGNRWNEIASLLMVLSEKEYPEDDLLRNISDKAEVLWELERDFYITVLENV
ncbi:MAG: BtrH N-terminal domain-containing protein [Thermodesulfobacteriota bacterium]